MSVFWSLIKTIALVVGLSVFGVLSFYFAFVIFQVYNVLLKSCFWRYKGRKKRLHIIWCLRKQKFDNITEFVKWVWIDFYRRKVKYKLYGIISFNGYFGDGKTLGAVSYAFGYKHKMAEQGVKIHIYSNFKIRGQDGQITSFEEIKDLPDCSILIFDEIQSSLSTNDSRKFPVELLWQITQSRKKKLCVFASCPVFDEMAVQLRRHTAWIVDCRNNLDLDRWFTYSFYRMRDYSKFQDNPKKLRKYRKFTHTLIASDYDYRRYDTNEIVERFDIDCE